MNTSALRYKFWEKKSEEIYDKLSNIYSIYSSGTVDKEY
jgi:hypothetical protein